MKAAGARIPPQDSPREDDGLVMRGTVAWAGGGSGPDFFVAMAKHPEWGHDHTVIGDLLEKDMAILEKILTLPTTVTPGSPPVTNLNEPVPFTLKSVMICPGMEPIANPDPGGRDDPRNKPRFDLGNGMRL